MGGRASELADFSDVCVTAAKSHFLSLRDCDSHPVGAVVSSEMKTSLPPFSRQCLISRGVATIAGVWPASEI